MNIKNLIIIILAIIVGCCIIAGTIILTNNTDNNTSILEEKRNFTVAYSIVGHEDTAKILGVLFNRETITMKEGDELYIAELNGGRLPEGATELPEGFSFQYSKITILGDDS